MFWIFTGAEIAILTLAIVACISGFVQIQKLSHSFRKPYDLDNLLSNVTIVGAYIYAIFSIISAGVTVHTLETKNIIVLIQNILLLIQVSCQGMMTIPFRFLNFIDYGFILFRNFWKFYGLFLLLQDS